MYWPLDTTREAVEAWAAYAIDRLGGRPRKAQYFLDRLAGVWSPPAKMVTCLGGSVHWQVAATSEGVGVVARLLDDASSAEIRHAAAAALVYAGDHGHRAAPAFRRRLVDDDVRVRILVARAAAALGLGEELRQDLDRAAADPIWTVRWYAAHALARVDAERACDILTSSAPQPGGGAAGTWIEIARVLPHATDELRRLVQVFAKPLPAAVAAFPDP